MKVRIHPHYAAYESYIRACLLYTSDAADE